MTGILPYMFSTTSHIITTLSMGLPMWLLLIRRIKKLLDTFYQTEHLHDYTDCEVAYFMTFNCKKRRLDCFSSWRHLNSSSIHGRRTPFIHSFIHSFRAHCIEDDTWSDARHAGDGGRGPRWATVNRIIIQFDATDRHGDRDANRDRYSATERLTVRHALTRMSKTPAAIYCIVM